jgi:hypothetical protein
LRSWRPIVGLDTLPMAAQLTIGRQLHSFYHNPTGDIMAFYKSSEEFYAVIQKGFDELAKDPKATADFHSRHMVVDIRLSDPSAEIMLDGRSNPIKTSFGPYAGKSDLKLELSTDLFHGILMGTESVKSAFMGGSVKVTGNVFRALQLKDLFYQISRLYPNILREMGYPV